MRCNSCRSNYSCSLWLSQWLCGKHAKRALPPGKTVHMQGLHVNMLLYSMTCQAAHLCVLLMSMKYFAHHDLM